MRLRFVGLTVMFLCALVLLPTQHSFAQDTNQPSDGIQAEKKQMQAEAANSDKIAEFKSSPAGVFAPEYQDGVLFRFKVKGEATVSNALRSSMAVRTAREEAIRDAKGKAMQWLKEKVSIQDYSSERIIITEQGKNESATATKVISKEFESQAAGILRGLIVLFDDVSGPEQDKTCSVVMGWSKKLAEAARTAQSEMEKEPENMNQPTNSNSGSVNSSGQSGVKSESRSAKDLDDF